MNYRSPHHSPDRIVFSVLVMAVLMLVLWLTGQA
jgi:hypothetical protein